MNSFSGVAREIDWEKLEYGFFWACFQEVPYELWRDDGDCLNGFQMGAQLYAEFKGWA